jgi:hypothetical protein
MHIIYKFFFNMSTIIMELIKHIVFLKQSNTNLAEAVKYKPKVNPSYTSDILSERLLANWLYEIVCLSAPM